MRYLSPAPNGRFTFSRSGHGPFLPYSGSSANLIRRELATGCPRHPQQHPASGVPAATWPSAPRSSCTQPVLRAVFSKVDTLAVFMARFLPVPPLQQRRHAPNPACRDPAAPPPHGITDYLRLERPQGTPGLFITGGAPSLRPI